MRKIFTSLLLAATIIAPSLIAPATTKAATNDVPLMDIQCDSPSLWLGNTDYMIDDTNPAVKYTGVWKAESGHPLANAYNGTQHVSMGGGYTVSYTAVTSPYKFAMGYVMRPDAGKVSVFYEGQLLGIIDAYSPTLERDCTVEFYWGPGPGKYEFRTMAAHNPLSTSSRFFFDFVYFES
ncbi:hypothetical protein [Herpetosiphon geysericola]|uniref:Uncharacterized protein n=1 Tax=Herpetosiphon geysericola TaxID=70996 RepID=A0A0P6YZG3_9CHLR|nr:hypothetical protein [Herpetosiphon geysericola]KPL90625.1 hypothetical protein SE18_06040 [Herpetosiphon geysericola]